MKKIFLMLIIAVNITACSNDDLCFYIENVNEHIEQATIKVEVNDIKVLESKFDYSNITHHYEKFNYPVGKEERVKLTITNVECGAKYEDSINVKNQNQIFVEFVNNEKINDCDFIVGYSDSPTKIR